VAPSLEDGRTDRSEASVARALTPPEIKDDERTRETLETADRVVTREGSSRRQGIEASEVGDFRRRVYVATFGEPPNPPARGHGLRLRLDSGSLDPGARCDRRARPGIVVTPSPAATSACWTTGSSLVQAMRGVNPAAWHASTSSRRHRSQPAIQREALSHHISVILQQHLPDDLLDRHPVRSGHRRPPISSNPEEVRRS
jgi:hypothetical protein